MKTLFNNLIKSKTICYIFWTIFSLLYIISQCFSQNGANTNTVSNAYRITAATDTTFEYSETLYIGPNAHYQLDGIYVVFSKNIWISATAQIKGSGKIILADPSANPFYTFTASATTLDHNNGENITVPIEIQNPNGVILGDINNPGFTESENEGAQLNIANSVTFGVNGGNVYLNNNDLNLGDTAKLIDFSANRLVVTNNNINGHLIKHFNTSNTFTFPIGITDEDYTPVTLTAQNGAYHASVTNYANSNAQIITPSEGIDRAWHIFGDATLSSLTLQHNISTNGSDYADNSGFITQYIGNGSWSTTTANEFVSSGVLSTNNIILASQASDSGVWLTKASDRVSPLPIVLKNFEIMLNNCVPTLSWSTGVESNFNHFEVERSPIGTTQYLPIAQVLSKGSNSDYTFIDSNQKENGTYLYRLKMIDNDQHFTYSKTISLSLNCKNSSITLYPNPAHEAVYLNGLTDETIIMYNSVGQEMMHQTATTGINTLNLNGLASGMYQINVVKNKQLIKTFKLILR